MSETTPEQSRALLFAALIEDEEMRERQPTNIATLRRQLEIEPGEELPMRVHRQKDNGR